MLLYLYVIQVIQIRFTIKVKWTFKTIYSNHKKNLSAAED